MMNKCNSKNTNKILNEFIVLSDSDDYETTNYGKKTNDDSVIVLDDDDDEEEEDFAIVRKTPSITAVKRSNNYTTPTPLFSQSIQPNRLLNGTCKSSSFDLNSNNSKRINGRKSSFEINKKKVNEDDDDDIIDITNEVNAINQSKSQQSCTKPPPPPPPPPLPITTTQQQVFKEKHINSNQILNNINKNIVNQQQYTKPSQNSQQMQRNDPSRGSSTTSNGTIVNNNQHNDIKKPRMDEQNEKEQTENRIQQSTTSTNTSQKEFLNKLAPKKQQQRRTIASESLKNEPQYNKSTQNNQQIQRHDSSKLSSSITSNGTTINNQHNDVKKPLLNELIEKEQTENHLQQTSQKMVQKKQQQEQRRTIASESVKSHSHQSSNQSILNIIFDKQETKTTATITCTKRGIVDTHSASTSNERLNGSESLTTNSNNNKKQALISNKVIASRRSATITTTISKEKQMKQDAAINNLINRDVDDEPPLDLRSICNKLSTLTSNPPIKIKIFPKATDNDHSILIRLEKNKLKIENTALLKSQAHTRISVNQTDQQQKQQQQQPQETTTSKIKHYEELSIGEYLLLNYCKTSLLPNCNECTFDELIEANSESWSKGDLLSVNSNIHLNLDNIIDTYIHNSNDVFHSSQIHTLLVGLLPIINHLDTHKMLDLFIKYNFICENKCFNSNDNNTNTNNDYCLLYENYLQLIECTHVGIDLSLTEINNAKWQSFIYTTIQLLDGLNQSVNGDLFNLDTLRLKCFYELFIKHGVYLYLLKRNKLKFKYNWLQVQKEFQLKDFETLFNKHLQTFESLFNKLFNSNDQEFDEESEECHQIIDNYVVEALNIIQRMIVFTIIYHNTNNDVLKTCLDQFVDKLVHLYLQLNKDSKRYLFINLINNIILINECKYKICEQLLLNGRYWLNSMNDLVNNNDKILHTVENMLNDKNGSTVKEASITVAKQKQKKVTTKTTTTTTTVTATAPIELKLEYLNLLFAYLSCHYELIENDNEINNPLLKQYINGSNSKKSINRDLLINNLSQIISSYLTINNTNTNFLLKNIVNKINLLIN